MESGLEDRNNIATLCYTAENIFVSMESGLEDRNNPLAAEKIHMTARRLNGVRPRRPEQCNARVLCRAER